MPSETLTPSQSDSLFDRLHEKIARGLRLDAEDGLALYRSADLLRLGRLAEQTHLARSGLNVYYCINRHINYTNVCTTNCSFCTFSRRPGDPDAYTMSPDDILAQADLAVRAGATELHIVGGIHPDLPLDYYLGFLRALRAAFPALHLKAFTAPEIIHLASLARRSVADTLSLLVSAGLGSLPGGGAEILDPDYFAAACPQKSRPDQWLDVHAQAHRLGLMSNATMLYGYLETPAQRINHLLALRRLQDDSLRACAGHFQCFVPLPYLESPRVSATAGQPAASPRCPSAILDLQTIAISRLMLDNIPHLKAFWPMLGVNLAQIALAFGADDLDGTVQQYRIVDKPADNAADTLSVPALCALIRETHRTPIQRDPFYHPLSLPPFSNLKY